MRLARHRHLDALCGEYLIGTLRGRPRRRFERALKEEPAVAARLAYWQRTFALRPTLAMHLQPHPNTWRRLQRDLQLARYRTPWWRRAGVWRAWAAAATAALVVAVGLQLQRATVEPSLVEVARLAAKDQPPAVTAALAPDHSVLELRAARPIEAGPAQSYELWVIPAEGGAPLSLAVLGRLDARFTVPEALRARLRAGATLAVSVEPAGGSPTGAPTGPVILVGKIGA
ncbi:MAG TPA: anti-sigma factor [Burkholderiaceae bacterium]|jgi:anti-sigma-K factor RskA|nr:anti-sigma factor [Burkholderiaceae bacterium]